MIERFECYFLYALCKLGYFVYALCKLGYFMYALCKLGYFMYALCKLGYFVYALCKLGYFVYALYGDGFLAGNFRNVALFIRISRFWRKLFETWIFCGKHSKHCYIGTY